MPECICLYLGSGMFYPAWDPDQEGGSLAGKESSPTESMSFSTVVVFSLEVWPLEVLSQRRTKRAVAEPARTYRRRPVLGRMV
jgi:hypothetical protein